MKQILNNKGYEKEDFSAKAYFYFEIANPKIMKTSDLEKDGFKISNIKNNSIINIYAPKVIEHE